MSDRVSGPITSSIVVVLSMVLFVVAFFSLGILRNGPLWYAAPEGILLVIAIVVGIYIIKTVNDGRA